MEQELKNLVTTPCMREILLKHNITTMQTFLNADLSTIFELRWMLRKVCEYQKIAKQKQEQKDKMKIWFKQIAKTKKEEAELKNWLTTHDIPMYFAAFLAAVEIGSLNELKKQVCKFGTTIDQWKHLLPNISGTQAFYENTTKDRGHISALKKFIMALESLESDCSSTMQNDIDCRQKLSIFPTDMMLQSFPKLQKTTRNPYSIDMHC